MTKVATRPTAAAPAAGKPESKGHPRQLPSPAPDTIKIGRLVATKVAQTSDMVRYEVHIKGKSTFIDLIEKFNPKTALPAPEGFLKGRKSVVLTDRDGVLNKAGSFLNKAADVTEQAMIPSALTGAKALDDAGVGLAIVTNQGGYQIGKMSFEDTIAVNVRVAQRIADAGGRVDAIIISPFNEALKSPRKGDVDSRKPAPGMPLYAMQLATSVGLATAGMVGDQRTDGAAGQGAGLKFFAITDTTNGRWADEEVSAKKKGETLPTLDRGAGKLVEVASIADVATQVIASLKAKGTGFTPGGAKAPVDAAAPGAALATGAAQTLRTTAKSSELPAAWLRGATIAVQEHAAADPRGYYDHRVAVHGDAAVKLLANLAKETGEAKPTFNAGSELLLVQVHGGDELYAELFAFDVLTGKTREVGQLDYDTIEPVLQWDGLSTPKALEKSVLLPLSNEAYDWGDQLVGFEGLDKSKLAEPLDFDALVKLGPSQQPGLESLSGGLSKAPKAVADLFALAAAGDGKSVTLGKQSLKAAAGTKFVEAGWSAKASIDASIEGLASPRLDRDKWIEAEDALSASGFGTDQARPLLWLKQDDGAVRFVAFSAKADQPLVLEIDAKSLKATLHGKAAA